MTPFSAPSGKPPSAIASGLGSEQTINNKCLAAALGGDRRGGGGGVVQVEHEALVPLAVGGAVRALEAAAGLHEGVHGGLGEDVLAGQQHRGVGGGRHLLDDGAGERGVPPGLRRTEWGKCVPSWTTRQPRPGNVTVH